MIKKYVEFYKLTSIFTILAGCSGIVTLLLLDKIYWNANIFEEGPPIFSNDYIFRSIVVFISIAAISWGLVSGSRPICRLGENSGFSLEVFSVLVTMFVSILILFLFVFEPLTFNTLSLEDGFVEWGSAVLLFGSCILIFISFLRSLSSPGVSKIIKLSLIFLCFVFFVIAMEEVSWFQRVLDIKTPEGFSSNLQDEMNLHNFYTNPVENLYYFGSFLFLVFLPFLRLFFPFISNSNYLDFFVARPFIVLVGSIACAYNFDMWNIIFTQIMFFGSVVALLAFFIFCNNKSERYLIFTVMFTVVFTQFLFLTNGENFSREWEVTEYKEFFIPLAFFIYSLDVLKHTKH